MRGGSTGEDTCATGSADPPALPSRPFSGQSQIEAAAQREEIIITKHGVPVAALVPVAGPRRPDTQAAIAAIKDFRRGRLTQAGTVQFLALLWQLPIVVERERPARMLGEILSLAREQGLSTCEATYLHLAMRQGFPLATTDTLLRQAAIRAGVPLLER